MRVHSSRLVAWKVRITFVGEEEIGWAVSHCLSGSSPPNPRRSHCWSAQLASGPHNESASMARWRVRCALSRWKIGQGKGAAALRWRPVGRWVVLDWRYQPVGLTPVKTLVVGYCPWSFRTTSAAFERGWAIRARFARIAGGVL